MLEIYWLPVAGVLVAHVCFRNAAMYLAAAFAFSEA